MVCLVESSPSRIFQANPTHPQRLALMISFGSNRLTRLGIGACLTLLVHGLCASQSARAGCGHLVESLRTHHASEITRLDPQLFGGGSTDLAVDDSTPRPDRRFPCSGPSCSGNVPPPVAPGVLTADRLDQWGTLATLFDFPPITPRTARAADAALRPIGQPAPIFHPPRMIASIAV